MEYLGYPHFMVTVILAVILHFMALFIWYISPHLKIVDIPVRVLNIRLGDSDVQQIQEDEVPPQPTADNSAQVESTMAKLIRQPVTEKVVKKPAEPRVNKVNEPAVKTPSDTKSVSDKIVTPKQFVRTMPVENKDKNNGSVLGNSNDSRAEIKSRYEQTISLWIQKFKLYPESARAEEKQGSTVIRIRIDRRGNIRYSALEGSTGHEELDIAALNMLRRANPVPAVPDNYPEGELFEFLIPVKFQIQ